MQQNSWIFQDANENVVEYDGSPLSWRVSVYGIVIKDQKLLIIKSKEEKIYDVPGGGIDFGEKIADALRREGVEEAGAVLKVGELLYINEGFFYHRQQQKFFQTLQLFYLADLEGELGKPSDPRSEFVSFVKLSELEKYPLPQAVQAAVKVALSKI